MKGHIAAPHTDLEVNYAIKEVQALIPDLKPGDTLTVTRHDSEDRSMAIFTVTLKEFH